MSAPNGLPSRERLKICFAHDRYALKSAFDALVPGIDACQVRSLAELESILPEIDVLVTSTIWRHDLLARAKRLVLLQSATSGMNQYLPADFLAKGVILCSAAGGNVTSVSEHAMALLLGLTRRIASARDNQARHLWRSAQADLAERETQLCGKIMLVIGLGAIGNRIAALATAFGMTVIGVRRQPGSGRGEAAEIHGYDQLHALLPRADVVLLSCPLSDQTRNILSQAEFSLMKPGARLVNVARGACVDEQALIAALRQGRLAGAALDVVPTEPLPATSPLWDMENVLLTPHSAGESDRLEQNVVSILHENLERLWQGRSDLLNRVA